MPKTYKILTPAEFNLTKSPIENGKSFTENSLIKAKYYSKKTGKIKNQGLSQNQIEKEAIEDVETEIKYDGYIKRQLKEIEKLAQSEKLFINKGLNYLSIFGLSSEAKEKLSVVKPQTLGQASRVSGVSPADISVLMLHLNKY